MVRKSVRSFAEQTFGNGNRAMIKVTEKNPKIHLLIFFFMLYGITKLGTMYGWDDVCFMNTVERTEFQFALLTDHILQNNPDADRKQTESF